MTQDPSRLLVQIAADPPSRLDKALARDVPEAASLSRSRLMKLIGEGAVSRDGAVLSDPKTRVTEGEAITIVLPEVVEIDAQPEAIPLEIAYEDESLIVVNKPAGMVVHPAPGTPSGTLVNALLHHFAGKLSGIGGAKRPGIVHRIDKDTSGLLVVAKSDAAHHGLAAQFADHSVNRRYLALCHGVPDAGDPRLRGLRGISLDQGALKITTHLARHKTDRQKQAVVISGGRHAVTRVWVEEAFATAAALIECRLETGRTHQIRVHLTYAGHALIGDPTYGGRRVLAAKTLGAEAAAAAKAFPRQALHAVSLGFVHPVTAEELSFDAPLPEDMDSLLQVLRSAAPSPTGR